MTSFQKFIMLTMQRRKQMINIYTDGATSHNGKENAIGGYAFVVEENGEELYSTYG